MLRVFRMKHIMRRHLEGAVMEAAGKLVFSLLSIVFIAAGLFYELEKYGVSTVCFSVPSCTVVLALLHHKHSTNRRPLTSQVSKAASVLPTRWLLVNCGSYSCSLGSF